MDSIALVLWPLGLFAGFACLIFIAIRTVGPVDWAIRHRRAALQYQMTDLFSLSVDIQIAMATVFVAIGHPLESRNAAAASIVIIVIVVLMVFGLWLGAVAAVSKGGVQTFWKRTFFVLVQLPATLTMMFAAAGCCLGLCMLVSGLVLGESVGWLWLVPVAFVAVIGLTELLRFSGKWVFDLFGREVVAESQEVGG